MSPTPPTLNPSQTVERIREIIVGRHLERLEGRVSRLESRPIPEPQPIPAHDVSIFEDRLLVSEAKIEALQEHVHRTDASRQEIEQIAESHRLEAQRLSSKIQQIAKESAEEVAVPAVEDLERRLAAWFPQWQTSLHARLDERDRSLAKQLGNSLAQLKESLENRIDSLESRIPEGMEKRFDRIAEAARALAESATSFSKISPSKQ